MAQLQDFTIDQLAGSVALVVSSFGGFMLILFKSRCTSICCGLCVRDPLPVADDEEAQQNGATQRASSAVARP